MVNLRSFISRTRGRTVPVRGLAADLRAIAVSAALLLLFSSPGLAQQKASEVDRPRSAGGGESFLYSRYVSRGIASSDGPVLQPAAWVTLDDFTLSVLGNYVLAREKQQGRFNEADVSLAWGREWNLFTIEPKFTLYTYPNTADQSQYEAGLTLARDLGPWRLSTFNSLTFAVSEKASYYGELALGYSHDFPDNWSVSLHAGCSIARSDAASDDNHASSSQDTLPQGRNGFVGLGLGFRF